MELVNVHSLASEYMEAGQVVRDDRGRVTKGSKLSPYGSMPRRQILALKKLEGLTDKAIKRLGELIDDRNGSVALAAAKEVLDRNLGKARQNVQVEVTSTSAMHLAALQELAERKRQQLIEAQAIDITPLSVSANPDITLDRIVSHDDQGAIDASVTEIDMSVTAEDPRQDDPGERLHMHPPHPISTEK
jgi:DNA-binding PucR family transcriptional regulator